MTQADAFLTGTGKSSGNSLKMSDRERTISSMSLTELREERIRDTEEQMGHELSKLLATAGKTPEPNTRQEFVGFQKLFSQFLRESGTPIDWSEIKQLPKGGVCVTIRLFHTFLCVMFV